MSWIRFGHPELLHLLWGVPALAGLCFYAFRRKRRAYRRFSQEFLFKRLTANVHFGRQKVKAALLVAGYLFLALAVARPQIGTKLEMVRRSGSDVMIALDISASMLAEDIKPNRLLKAKHAIGTLVDRLRGDRVGLIAFAGDSFIQCPLTTDYAAVKLLLDALDVDTISLGGTDISDAIDTALESFKRGEDKYKALVFFTDGEDHSAAVTASVKKAVEQGVRIYTVGVGSPQQGSPIPLREASGEFRGYKRDRRGELVVTKLEDRVLREIAQTTGGSYFQATPDEKEVDRLAEALASLERRDIESRQFTQFEERYQYFVAMALICLILEMALPERRKTLDSTSDGT